jgi:outer membrane protein assembly factor BamE (lipoprotein component of BamABCDE complex)
MKSWGRADAAALIAAGFYGARSADMLAAMRPAVPLLAASLLAPSCYLGETSLHHPFPPEKVAALEPGRSTAQQVADALGAPARVVELGEGSAWLYEHGVTKDAALWLLLIALRGNETQTDRVWVFFDARGVLTHVAASFEAGEASYAIPPWS